MVDMVFVVVEVLEGVWSLLCIDWEIVFYVIGECGGFGIFCSWSYERNFELVK